MAVLAAPGCFVGATVSQPSVMTGFDNVMSVPDRPENRSTFDGRCHKDLVC